MIKLLLALLLSFSVISAKIVVKNNSKYIITLVGRKSHVLEPAASASFDSLPCNETGHAVFNIQHHLHHFYTARIKYVSAGVDILTFSVFHEELILISMHLNTCILQIPLSNFEFPK